MEMHTSCVNCLDTWSCKNYINLSFIKLSNVLTIKSLMWHDSCSEFVHLQFDLYFWTFYIVQPYYYIYLYPINLILFIILMFIILCVLLSSV